ncbi:MAG: hypothetical protein IPM23_03225 [Candidatus Melainabacteria bacterium]|nr:hypothetical protein [Candidatus Melainabacteria bacterium]
MKTEQSDFRVGDRVEILRYRKEIAWGDRKPQRFGFITSIDGAYILIRPRWWKAGELIERYPSEIRHAPGK